MAILLIADDHSRIEQIAWPRANRNFSPMVCLTGQVHHFGPTHTLYSRPQPLCSWGRKWNTTQVNFGDRKLIAVDRRENLQSDNWWTTKLFNCATQVMLKLRLVTEYLFGACEFVATLQQSGCGTSMLIGLQCTVDPVEETVWAKCTPWLRGTCVASDLAPVIRHLLSAHCWW